MLSSSSPAASAASSQRSSSGAQRVVVAQRGGRERARDERAASLARDDEALALELAVGLRDGVRVDREIGDDLAHRRQLVADVDRPQPQRLLDLLHDLQVGGDTGARVEVELDHPADRNALWTPVVDLGA